MKAFVTEATGFLGSHLIPALLIAGHDIVIVKRSFSDTWRINEYISDISSYDVDRVKLGQPFRDHGKIDAGIHRATKYGRKGEKATEVCESNLGFPLRVLEIATFFNTATILHRYLNFYALSKKQFKEGGP